MLYRVEFQIAYGGFYYSESFEDFRDADHMRTDILSACHGGGWIRFLRIEMSDDNGETWEPWMYQTEEA